MSQELTERVEWTQEDEESLEYLLGKKEAVTRISAGRPSAITDELIERLARSIRVGATVTVACDSVGITRMSFWRWMKKAEEIESRIAPILLRIEEASYNDEEYKLSKDEQIALRLKPVEEMLLKLSYAVQRAKGQGAVRSLMHIARAASNGLWTAAAWQVERMYPEEFARKDDSNSSGTVVQQFTHVEVVVPQQTTEELTERREKNITPSTVVEALPPKRKELE